MIDYWDVSPCSLASIYHLNINYERVISFHIEAMYFIGEFFLPPCNAVWSVDPRTDDQSQQLPQEPENPNLFVCC
jgi:hypothetical protein